MDIESFLFLKHEVTLLKELLFDKNQLLVFDTFSKVINFRNLFKEMKKDNMFFKEQTENEFKIVFESLNFILNRENNDDKKIIKFIDLFLFN